MQNLLNQLVSGTVEFQDGGVQINIPPTAIMLKAARSLKQFLEVNETNNTLIQQLQAREAELLVELEQFRVQQRDLYNQLTIKEQNERIQSVRNAEQQTSNGGGDQPNVSGSDQASKDGVADTDGGTSIN